MKPNKTITGQDLREMFAAATDWLEKSVPDIDALNVFPVPDGDCGTNMLLTMRSSLEEGSRANGQKISSVVKAMAKGALMGARGNSGVILSQIWRGLARSLNSKEIITGKDLAEALCQASETAYTGLSNPVEGTILTVMREAAMAAQGEVAGNDGDVLSVLEAAVNAAREAVAKTPALLPVLREAGVVDAGGQGLYTLLEGALLYLRGEVEAMRTRKSEVIVSSLPLSAEPLPIAVEEEIPYGYCTEFLLRGENLDPDNIRVKLKKKGQSLIVVGDESTVRVHIHSLDPSSVIHDAVSLGTLHNISIRNMDEQHQDFITKQKQRKMIALKVAVVTVVNGEGLAKVFRSLGVSAIIPGGQTMNPSIRDILQAVEASPSEKVIILPNNKNVVLTARQVASLTKKKIEVVPTETIPQGITALMAFNPEADFTTTVKLMNQYRVTVKTLEVTRASRSTSLNGLNIKQGQVIGLLDGKLLSVGDDTGDVVADLMSQLDLDEAEVVTIYSGVEAHKAEIEKVRARIQQKFPSLEVEVVSGGQPHYSYIISVE